MKKLVILCVSFIIFSTPSFGQVVQFTLDNAIDIALKNNLELQAKRKNIDILKEEIRMANALKNPEFRSNFLIGKVTQGNSSQFGLAIPIEIAKRGVRKKSVIAQLNIAENEIKQAEHNLKIEVMGAYFDILYMKSLVFILNEREELYREMQEIANKKSDDVEKLQADIKYKKQLILLNKAKADLLNAQFVLNDVLNLKDNSIMYDTSELYLFGNVSMLKIELPQYSDIEDIAMKYSYSIKIAQDNIEKSEYDVKIAQHKRIPDVTLSGGYAYQTANQTGYEALPGAFVGANVNLPVFYTYRPEIKRAYTIVEKTKINKESFESRLRFALKEEYNQFKYAKENIKYYKDILKDSDDVLKFSKDNYQKGKISFMNFLLIENWRQEIIHEYISAMSIYYHAYLDLMRNVGHDILLKEEIL